MRRLLLLLLFPVSAFGLTPESREWIEISAKLEPVQCEKRQLRRELLQAEVEKRDADAKRLRARFAELNHNPQTAQMERRLAVLKARILDSRGHARNPEDLEAISLQRRQAFYRCE